MRELELTVRVRNNRLKERREQLGMTQGELAAAVGLNKTSYCGLECMRDPPRNSKGDWGSPARKLAAFHCVEPDELFPPAVEGIKQASAVRRLDVSDLEILLSTHQEMLLEGPHGALERHEMRDKIQLALSTLTPREEAVVRLRFGLDDGIDLTMAEVGEEYGISGERVRQIECKALKKLSRLGPDETILPFHGGSGGADL